MISSPHERSASHWPISQPRNTSRPHPIGLFPFSRCQRPSHVASKRPQSSSTEGVPSTPQSSFASQLVPQRNLVRTSSVSPIDKQQNIKKKSCTYPPSATTTTPSSTTPCTCPISFSASTMLFTNPVVLAHTQSG
jgi:hypothetical protein